MGHHPDLEVSWDKVTVNHDPLGGRPDRRRLRAGRGSTRDTRTTENRRAALDPARRGRASRQPLLRARRPARQRDRLACRGDLRRGPRGRWARTSGRGRARSDPGYRHRTGRPQPGAQPRAGPRAPRARYRGGAHRAEAAAADPADPGRPGAAPAGQGGPGERKAARRTTEEDDCGEGERSGGRETRWRRSSTSMPMATSCCCASH